MMRWGLYRSILGLFFLMAFMATGNAQEFKLNSNRSGRSDSLSERKHRYETSLDLGVVYLRDTRPMTPSDVGGRMNFGGMFSDWIGLDVTGLYYRKSGSYLVGGDLKLVPIDWLFAKMGAAAFSDKKTGLFRTTPTFGGGITGRFSEYYYIVAEGLVFRTPDQGRTVGMGVSLGTIF